MEAMEVIVLSAEVMVEVPGVGEVGCLICCSGLNFDQNAFMLEKFLLSGRGFRQELELVVVQIWLS